MVDPVAIAPGSDMMREVMKKHCTSSTLISLIISSSINTTSTFSILSRMQAVSSIGPTESQSVAQMPDAFMNDVLA